MITEFDEQIATAIPRKLLKRTLVETYRAYKKGDETMGVLSGFEIAAIRAGISLTTIEEWYKEDVLY